MSDDTYYTVLGIPETATQGEIERRYRGVVAAYQVLSDSTQRSSYDQQLALYRLRNAPVLPLPPKASANRPPITTFFRLEGLDYPKGTSCLFPRETSSTQKERVSYVGWVELRPQPTIGEHLGFLAVILFLFAFWYQCFRLFVIVFDG
jgi:curved DNA-binding protein CbpA